MSFPVFDLHCDTALALLGDDLNGSGELRTNGFHIDLERAGSLSGYAQCFACFTTDWREIPGGISVEQLFDREQAVILRELERNSDKIRLALSARQIEENRKSGMQSGILTIEGTAGIGYDPGRLETLYQTGFRISTLTWNEKNPLAGSHVTGGALTDRGREYVREAQRLGIVIDVSHLSDEAFWDIIRITQAPIVASHSNSRSVCNVSRILTDDMFLAICRSGGFAGINQYVDFIGGMGDLDAVCDHIFHFLELDPDGDHIALGGDLDGCDELPVGFGGVQDYPRLAQRLLERGAGEALVHKIYWENAIGVIAKCSM